LSKASRNGDGLKLPLQVSSEFRETAFAACTVTVPFDYIAGKLIMARRITWNIVHVGILNIAGRATTSTVSNTACHPNQSNRALREDWQISYS
jgi:hypothetical protein